MSLRISERVTKNFASIGSNAKVLVATEPFWSIPINWTFFYRIMFLRESLGLSEIQIGFLSSVLTLFSAVSPLAGGYLADRFGRKKVFMAFDVFGWLGSLAVWIFTRNIWFALAAYVLEGGASVIFSVWECLLVEDTKPKHRASIYGYLSASSSLGTLSIPIAGVIVGLYGLDFGCRILFVTAFAALVPMYAIRQLYLREPAIGFQIAKEERFAGFRGYLSSLSIIKRNRTMMSLLFISIIVSSYTSVITFLPLYLVDKRGLGLSEEVASLVPAVSAMSALVIAFYAVPKLRSRKDYLKTLSLGFGMGCAGLLVLLSSPVGNLFLSLVSGAILGFYQAIGFSVSRTFLANEIDITDSRARAKILSITLTLSSLVNLPVPVLAGYLFSLGPKLPFVAVSSALITGLLVLVISTKQEKNQHESLG